jgi:ribosome-associated toxin RatA of RatAB toxin-antitoxin module
MIKAASLVFAISFATLVRAGHPCEIVFSDSLGKLLKRGDDFAIRLIESPTCGPKIAETRFLVNASKGACWKVITDYEHYPEFMPNMRSAKPLSGNGESGSYEFSLKVALWTIRYAINIKTEKPDSTWTLSWTYLRGDLKSTTGSWELTECKERPGFSIACYRVCVEPFDHEVDSGTDSGGEGTGEKPISRFSFQLAADKALTCDINQSIADVVSENSFISLLAK